MGDKTGARERIIFAAIGILEKDGARGITTRRIAAEAGVNTAAVNYYFGSKEELVRQVLSLTLSHGFADWIEVLEDRSLDAPSRLHAALSIMLEGIERNPGVVRAHMFESGVMEESRVALGGHLSSFLDAAATLLSPTGAPETDLRLRLGVAVLAVMSAGLMTEQVETVSPSGRQGIILALFRRNWKRGWRSSGIPPSRASSPDRGRTTVDLPGCRRGGATGCRGI